MITRNYTVPEGFENAGENITVNVKTNVFRLQEQTNQVINKIFKG